MWAKFLAFFPRCIECRLATRKLSVRRVDCDKTKRKKVLPRFLYHMKNH